MCISRGATRNVSTHCQMRRGALKPLDTHWFFQRAAAASGAVAANCIAISASPCSSTK